MAEFEEPTSAEDTKNVAQRRTSSLHGSTLENDLENAFRNATQEARTPIKISFENVNYSVQIQTTKAERKADPQIG